MKILHLIDSGGLYGAEKVILNLGVECQKIGHEVVVGTIVAPEDVGDPLGDAAKADDLNHVQFEIKDGLNIPGLGRILKFAREGHFDVIHSHGYKSDILLSLSPRRLRSCPLVSTVHGWTAGARLSKIAVYEWLHRRMLRGFDAVIAVSEPIAASLKRQSCSVVLIPNGISIPELRQSTHLTRPERPHLAPVQLLAAGRLSYEKGFDVLIEAVDLLRSKGIAVELTIAGDGPCHESLLDQVNRFGLMDAIHLVGYAQDLNPLFELADLFVLPSRTEGLPMVLLEAMSRNVPVVATAVGQVSDVLLQGGLGRLVDPGSAEALADAISTQLNTSQQQTTDMTRRAAERIRQTYSSQAMALEYCAIYRSVQLGH